MPKVASPVKYFGGKGYLADWIISHFPEHTSYVEPYLGGGSVLLAKNPDGISEVVNDVDGVLTAFWKVLQDDGLFDSFRRMVEATPFSESEWQDARDIIEAARREPAGTLQASLMQVAVPFFVFCRQSLSGRMESFAPVSTSRTRRSMNEQCSAWLSAIDGLPAVHNRLKRVLILNRKAVDVIRQFDKPGVLAYLDPTYPAETRTSKDVYQYEMTTADHQELLATCLKVENAKIVLSSYRNQMYDDALKGWRVEQCEVANHAASGEKKRRMTEVIYMNY